jgi:hypothetical protein
MIHVALSSQTFFITALKEMENLNLLTPVLTQVSLLHSLHMTSSNITISSPTISSNSLRRYSKSQS